MASLVSTTPVFSIGQTGRLRLVTPVLTSWSGNTCTAPVSSYSLSLSGGFTFKLEFSPVTSLSLSGGFKFEFSPVISLSFTGGFTPCRHLRPSSGREHTVI